MVVFDTSLIIDFLRRKNGEKTSFEKIVEKLKRNELAVSVLSIQELYQGKSMDKDGEEIRIQKIILPFNVLAYSVEIAKKAGKIVRDSNYSVAFADAAIAATAIVNGAELATLNIKDFLGIKNLEIYKV